MADCQGDGIIYTCSLCMFRGMPLCPRYKTPEPPRMNGETTVATSNASGFTTTPTGYGVIPVPDRKLTIYDRAWQALTGRDDQWGGCADKEAVYRIAAAMQAKTQ